MKALSITQPWASLIAAGCKRIETRSRSTAYRGPLAIHAARAFPPQAQALCRQSPFDALLRDAGLDVLDLPRGAVVATAQLVGCRRMVDDRRYLSAATVLISEAPPLEQALGFWKPGRWAWVLDEVRPLARPAAAHGLPWLWEWDR